MRFVIYRTSGTVEIIQRDKGITAAEACALLKCKNITAPHQLPDGTLVYYSHDGEKAINAFGFNGMRGDAIQFIDLRDDFTAAGFPDRGPLPLRELRKVETTPEKYVATFTVSLEGKHRHHVIASAAFASMIISLDLEKFKEVDVKVTRSDVKKA
jgi:hypothetical protein